MPPGFCISLSRLFSQSRETHQVKRLGNHRPAYQALHQTKDNGETPQSMICIEFDSSFLRKCFLFPPHVKPPNTSWFSSGIGRHFGGNGGGDNVVAVGRADGVCFRDYNLCAELHPEPGAADRHVPAHAYRHS